jgi:hypothetical protein
VKVILGDNPFFGVNHRTGSKALDDENERFDAAAVVIAAAQAQGIRSLMLSTHPGYERLLIKAAGALSEPGQFAIAPVVPYPHTINNIIAQDGYYGVLKKFGLQDVFAVTAEAVKVAGFFGRNDKAKLERAFRLIIDVELECIRGTGFAVRHVCLHNIVTDLLLAFGRFDILQGFINACSGIGVRPVLITQNPAVILAAPLAGPYVACFSYNKLGYMVNPSLEKTVEAIRRVDRKNCEMWAMQILAGGAITPEEALQDEALNCFDALLYATTKAERIDGFMKMLERSGYR